MTLATNNWYELLDIDSSGRFLVWSEEWQQRIQLRWYADFMAYTSSLEQQEEEIVWVEEEWKTLEDVLAEFEYNIRQEIKQENAMLLENITKEINKLINVNATKNNKK